MPKFLSSVEFNKNEAKEIVIQPLASAPSSPVLGQIYFNTTDNKTYRYTGSNWETYESPLPSQTGNNGKVLTTNGSSMSWENVPTELPTVSSSDNGKFLSVVSGNWSVVEIPIYTDTITTTTTWSGSSSPYTQVVTLANYTPTSNSKVDIQPDATTINQLITDSVKALYVSNSSGILTMYAVGASPTVSLTLQVTITEVTVA